jgi:acyl-CoA dehydrogenase
VDARISDHSQSQAGGRQARPVDGASEVHKMVVAHSHLEPENAMWDWKDQSTEGVASKE